MQEYIHFFQHNAVLSILWLTILIALASLFFKSASSGIHLVSVSEMVQLINKENGIVVDVRSSHEFNQGHIVNSLHILPSDIQKDSFHGIEKFKSNPVVVVCRTGQTAQSSATALVKAGFDRVSVLRHGLMAWEKANLMLLCGEK